MSVERPSPQPDPLRTEGGSPNWSTYPTEPKTLAEEDIQEKQREYVDYLEWKEVDEVNHKGE